MPKYFYNVLESSDTVDDSYVFESAHHDPQWVAEDAAEDYHANHDGWEAEWPIVFIIWDRQKNLIGEFEVEREYNPSFSADAI